MSSPHEQGQRPASVPLSLIQMACGSSKKENLQFASHLIREAAREGAKIVCLQELFASPYLCQSEDHRQFDWAEPIPGETTITLCKIARELEIVIVAPLFERRTAGLYHNTAAVIDADGSMLGKYRKMHIPDDPLYYEKFYFTPGDLGFQVFATRYARLGVGICWDQWFPEAARLLALGGAEILLFPTAIGWIDEEKSEFGASQVQAWRTVMQSHAITNGVWLAAPNRVGTEERLEFWGQSFICDPNGQIVAEGSDRETSVITADINLAAIDFVRTHWPFLRDRRIDAYNGLNQRLLD